MLTYPIHSIVHNVQNHEQDDGTNVDKFLHSPQREAIQVIVNCLNLRPFRRIFPIVFAQVFGVYQSSQIKDNLGERDLGCFNKFKIFSLLNVISQACQVVLGTLLTSPVLIEVRILIKILPETLAYLS